MLEYVFFEEEPRRRFQAFLEQHDLSWTLESAQPESVVVVDDTRMDAELADRLESLYDELFVLEQSLFAAARPQSQDHQRAAGVLLHLKDGTALQTDLPPELVKRVLAAITPEELDLIADAVVCAFEDLEGQAPS